MKRINAILLAGGILAGTALAGGDAPVLQTGTVLAQDYHTQESGSTTMPLLFGGRATRPLLVRVNTVDVQVGSTRMQWAEQGGRNSVILTVGGSFSFYEEKGTYIVIDGQGKKHKFGLIGKQAIAPAAKPAEQPAPAAPDAEQHFYSDK